MNNTWESEKLINVFISHKFTHQDKAEIILSEIEKFAICGFLAHRDIEPLGVWANEIRNKLRTMDILIALLTDDFWESNWTDHEIGAAAGRGISIIPVKAESLAPYGIIEYLQAIGYKKSLLFGKDTLGRQNTPSGIVQLIFEKTGNNDKIVESILDLIPDCRGHNHSFIVEKLLPCIKELSEEQANRMIRAYWYNMKYRCQQIDVIRDSLKNLLDNLRGGYADDIFFAKPDYYENITPDEF